MDANGSAWAVWALSMAELVLVTATEASGAATEPALAFIGPESGLNTLKNGGRGFFPVVVVICADITLSFREAEEYLAFTSGAVEDFVAASDGHGRRSTPPKVLRCSASGFA